MLNRVRFEIVLDRDVAAHFAAIERQDRTQILDAIDTQLSFEPVVPTRNRKALRLPNTLNATWELRCGAGNRYRVFYDVDVDNRVVVVLAVGRKVRSSLFVGSEEFVL